MRETYLAETKAALAALLAEVKKKETPAESAKVRSRCECG